MEEYQDVDVKFDDVVEFDRETVVLQKCAAKQDWETFKEKITKQLENNNAMKLLDPFDLFKNTVLHAVARGIIKKKAVARSSGSNAKLLQELLEMLPEEQQREALTKENMEGNTLLHEAVINLKEDCLETVDVIMKLGEKILNEPNGYYLQELLEHKNKVNETPVYRAAKYGNLNVLKYIHIKYQKLQADKHLPASWVEEGRFRPIIHECLLRFKFGVAIWLMNEVDRELALAEYIIVIKDEEEDIGIKEAGFRCLQLLSKMRLAFRSTDTEDKTLRQKLIYHMLPDEGYESELELDGAGNNSFKSIRDIESGQPADDNNTPKSTFSRINYAVWKFSKEKYYAVWKFSKEKYYAVWKLLAKDFKCSVGKIWDQKKKHKYAEHLAKWLVEIDQHWKGKYRTTLTDQRTLTLVRDFPSNVTEKKKEIELKKRVKKKVPLEQKILKQIMNIKPKSEEAEDINIELVVEENKTTSSKTNEVEERETNWETPLFLAAASGIKEVVEIILENQPKFIDHVNKEGLNILHLAIKHRQLEIYEYIKGNEAAFQSLRSRISNNDRRTILHQAASMDYYREQARPGVAYQLQDELDWYHRVESIVPKHFLMHCDNESLTPGDLLDVEHAEMHDQAKQWMKETAQSCSTVAVLIAGVVFAAAYTIPGGTSKNGKAELLNTPAVQFFTVMDVMALACSLGSVVMFLSILTSSFDLWDFHKSLPRKLKLGFIMLFCALIATILAFAATILLTVHMEGNKKTTTIIYSLAFMVVSVFGLTQFPLYKMIEDMVKQCTQRWKKVRKQA